MSKKKLGNRFKKPPCSPTRDDIDKACGRLRAQWSEIDHLMRANGWSRAEAIASLGWTPPEVNTGGEGVSGLKVKDEWN